MHQRAGSTGVTELHGSISRSRCMRRTCGPAFPDERVPAVGEVPECPRCGRACRPDVVLFGEQLSAPAVREVGRSLRQADLCLHVGTSARRHVGTSARRHVWPAAGFVDTAHAVGAHCVLVNAEEWDEPNAAFDEVHLGHAATLLPALLEGVR